MFHQLHVELCNCNEELSTFVENFEYTIKKKRKFNVLIYRQTLTNGQIETLKIRFEQCFNMIGQLLFNS
jgi:hypothetical protein